MPTYEYLCAKCGSFELVQRITEDPLKVCPSCGSSVARIISPAPFLLKGTGWYKTDYGAASSSGGNGHGKNGHSIKQEKTEAAESSTETKPAAKESSETDTTHSSSA